MKGAVIKLAIALLTFVVGAGVAYSVWTLRSDPEIDPVAIPAPEPPTPSADFARGGRATTIEEEWESIKTTDVCLNPMTDLLDSFPSLKRDEPRAGRSQPHSRAPQSLRTSSRFSTSPPVNSR